jgi:hypothetical protein
LQLLHLPEHHRHDIEVEKENIMGKKLFSVVTGLIASALVLTACSSGSDEGSAVGTNPGSWTPITLNIANDGQVIDMQLGQTATIWDDSWPEADASGGVTVSAEDSSVVRISQQENGAGDYRAVPGITAIKNGETLVSVTNGAEERLMSVTIRVVENTQPAKQAAESEARSVAVTNNTDLPIALTVSGTDNFDWEGARPDKASPQGFQNTELAVGETATRNLTTNTEADGAPFTLNFGETGVSVELNTKREFNTKAGISESVTRFNGWGQRNDRTECETNTITKNGYTITVECKGAFASPNTTVTITK